jgi:hypothetical protein
MAQMACSTCSMQCQAVIQPRRGLWQEAQAKLARTTRQARRRAARRKASAPSRPIEVSKVDAVAEEDVLPQAAKVPIHSQSLSAKCHLYGLHPLSFNF